MLGLLLFIGGIIVLIKYGIIKLLAYIGVVAIIAALYAAGYVFKHPFVG